MPLTWTRAKDGEHNGRPRYEYNAVSGNRTYHIVWAYDAGFGYSAYSRVNEKNIDLSPRQMGLSWNCTLKNCKKACELIEGKFS